MPKTIQNRYFLKINNIQTAYFFCFYEIQKISLNLLEKALVIGSSYLICTMELSYKQGLHRRKSFYKSLLNSAYLWSRARLAINKKQSYFLLQDHQLAKNLILFLASVKEQKRDKSEFLTNFVGIIVALIFI